MLIEDLLEQEKLEQMKQQKASHQQEPIGPVDLNLSDMEYEKLKADVLSVGNPPVGLSAVPGIFIKFPIQFFFVTIITNLFLQQNKIMSNICYSNPLIHIFPTNITLG